MINWIRRALGCGKWPKEYYDAAPSWGLTPAQVDEMVMIIPQRDASGKIIGYSGTT